jgi:acetyl-CoA C-acetyltransferase
VTQKNDSQVYIIGVGMTKFDEWYEYTPSSLATQALLDSVENAKIKKELLETVFVGSLLSATCSQTSIGAEFLRECNLAIPTYRIEAGNASGAAAFHQGFLSVKSGLYDCIAVVGVEKLSDYVKNGSMEKILGTTIDYHWEFEMGATLTSLYAILTKLHIKEYRTTLEQIASVLVKNHKNGINNEKAQYRKELPIDYFLSAKRISEPIGRFDPATHCDGSASVILASSDFVSNHHEITNSIPILASSQATDSISLNQRSKLTELKATKLAAKKAYEIAEISPKKINIAEVHDSYPIGEILAIEDLGFFEKGSGGKAIEDGLTDINKEISVNPSGGLKARGDPFGATGLAQIIEIVEQLSRKAKNRQISENNYGLTQNVVGTGAMTFVNIFANPEVL